MKHRFRLIPLFLFLLASLVATVKAETFDIMEVPNYIDNQLGCGVFIAGLLASLFVLIIVLLPIIYMTKGKAYSLYIVLGLAVLSPLVGLGWFPLYVFIIIILAIALKFGRELAGILGGLRI